MIKRSSALISKGITKELLLGCISEHRKTVKRFERLDNYYVGKHDVLSRKKTGDKAPNNKIVANFPKYITDTAIGYMFGNPVAYKCDGAPLDNLNQAFSRIDIDTHDAELGKDLSVFGTGFELVYMSGDEKPEPRITLLDPRETFVVYSDTVAEEPLFGVYYHKNYTEGGKDDGYTIYAYTAEDMTVYKAGKPNCSPEELTVLSEKEPHYFGGVPIVQYWNNEEGMGDYEHVISEIDAYNTLQSDRVNDKERFVSAIFVVEGGTLGDDEDDVENTARKLDNGFLEVPDGGKVYYLTKTLNESETDVLRKSISDDIHKFSQTPDFSDENFASNASGVAMQYKLTSLENMAKVKQGFFAAGLRERLKLFTRILFVQGKPFIDPSKIKITFNRTLPVNELETAQTVSIYAAGGLVSTETLLERVSFVTDKKTELDKLRAERDEKDKRTAALLGTGGNVDDMRL